MVLLILALAEVQMVRISDRMTVLYLVDESLSVPEDRRLAERRYVNAAIRRHRHGGDRAGVIVFGREAAIEVPPYDDNVQMLRADREPDLRRQHRHLRGDAAGRGHRFPKIPRGGWWW